MSQLDKFYWENRWLEKQTQWDTGEVVPPIKNYIDSLSDHNLKILIPGAGNGYEAQYLHQQGFRNTYILDIAKEPLKVFLSNNPEFPKKQIVCDDFFKLNESFDLILEYTFFCALHPDLRKAYADKVFQLLNPKGTLAGCLFNFPLTEKGPPFGGSKEEYISYFREKFHIERIEEETESIAPRLGKELFIELKKK